MVQKRLSSLAGQFVRNQVGQRSLNSFVLRDFGLLTQHEIRFFRRQTVFGSQLLSYPQRQFFQVEALSQDLREVEITFASELTEGQHRSLKVGEDKQDVVLVTRYQDKLYASGAFCSHFGLPLESGAVFEDKIICPFHSAQFSVVTGEPETAPALDGIPTYGIVEKDGKSFVQVPSYTLPKKLTQKMVKRDPENSQHFVIVGGGASGLMCAETLRQSGFTGQITIVSNEDRLPYDRTMLTKNLAAGDSANWTLRNEEFLKNADIDFKLNAQVASVDIQNKKVTLQDGSVLEYTKLNLAPGARAFEPKIDGIDGAKGVFYVRTHHDQQKCKELAEQAKSIVVLGSSFIGSEAAQSLSQKYGTEKQIHLISSSGEPFVRIFGSQIGARIVKQHVDAGVNLHLGSGIKTINTNEDKTITSVQLKDDSTLACDLLIIGAGVKLNTEFLKDSGLELANDGGIVCDEFLQTTQSKDVFASGDALNYPFTWGGKTAQIRTEHWVTAQDMGTYAAFNMLDRKTPYKQVPFFWTMHYGKGLAFIGHLPKGVTPEIYVEGSVEEFTYLAYYIHPENDTVLAVCGQNKRKEIISMFEAMNRGVMATGTEIKSGKETFETIVDRVQKTKKCACKREKICKNASLDW